VLNLAMQSVMTVIAELFLRFLFFYQQWPFRLGNLLDTRMPAHERQKCANEFLSASSCCLEPGFARRAVGGLHVDVCRSLLNSLVLLIFRQVIVDLCWPWLLLS